MRMYPRRYSPLNRAIARSVGYAINQKYRNSGGYSNSNTNTTTNTTNTKDLDVGVTILALIFIGILLYIFPILIIPLFFIILYSF